MSPAEAKGAPMSRELRAKEIAQRIVQTLQSDGFFAPASASYVEDRIKFILEDSNLAVAEYAPPADVESLAAKFHEIYQAEARRQGDVRHAEKYADLPENIKEFDRVLARYVLQAPKYNRNRDGWNKDWETDNVPDMPPQAPQEQTERVPTITFDGTYYDCARCGNHQTVLCEHWQALFERAYASIEATAKPKEPGR